MVKKKEIDKLSGQDRNENMKVMTLGSRNTGKMVVTLLLCYIYLELHDILKMEVKFSYCQKVAESAD